jgi:hypothetical protein
MAQTPEKRVKTKVSSILREGGTYFFAPATHGYGRSGVPDIVACVNGWFLAIECKAGKGKVTALQQRELNQIRAAGGISLVINEGDIDTVRGWVAFLKGHTRPIVEKIPVSRPSDS